MQETIKKALTGDFDKKKGLWFLFTAIVTLIVWNLPSGVFGIEGLTIVQQRVIAIFVMGRHVMDYGIHSGMGHIRDHYFRVVILRKRLFL